MAQNPLSTSNSTLLGAVSVLVLIIFYTGLSARQHAINETDTTIPGWSQIYDGMKQAVEVNERLKKSNAKSADELSSSNWIVQVYEYVVKKFDLDSRWICIDFFATSYRLALGMGIGIAISIVLGVIMGCSFYVEALLVPPLAFLAKVPATGMMAVFFALVGTDTSMFLAVIAFGLVPSLAQVVFLAVREVPDELVYKARTLGASRMEIIWDVIVPHAFPKILDAIRLQIGPAVVYLIAAEMLVSDAGLGYRIRLQSRLLNMSVVYPYLALLAGVGFMGDYSLRWLRSKLCPWYGAE